MPTPSENLRDIWLDTLLPYVPERGWTNVNAKQAARDAELSSGEQALAAPNGVRDLIDHFFDRAADQMLTELATQDLSGLRTHERVARGISTWLDLLEPEREAVRKAAGHGLLPWGAGAATRRVWSTADAIWEAAGDTATDYNRQTKRALLSATLPSIVLYWLDQTDPEAVDQYIEKRLQTAMRIGQFGSKILGPALGMIDKIRTARPQRDL